MIDEEDFRRQVQYGDDSNPVMAGVPEPPPSHWGKITSQARTLSAQYLKFLGRKDKEAPSGGE